MGGYRRGVPFMFSCSPRDFVPRASLRNCLSPLLIDSSSLFGLAQNTAVFCPPLPRRPTSQPTLGIAARLHARKRPPESDSCLGDPPFRARDSSRETEMVEPPCGRNRCVRRRPRRSYKLHLRRTGPSYCTTRCVNGAMYAIRNTRIPTRHASAMLSKKT